MFGNWTTVLTTQLSEDVERVSENPTEEREEDMEVHEDSSSVILPGENHWPKNYWFLGPVTCCTGWMWLFWFCYFIALLKVNKNTNFTTYFSYFTNLIYLFYVNQYWWKAREVIQGLIGEHFFVRNCAQSNHVQHIWPWDNLVCHLPWCCVPLEWQWVAGRVCARFTWARCSVE